MTRLLAISLVLALASARAAAEPLRLRGDALASAPKPFCFSPLTPAPKKTTAPAGAAWGG